MAESRNRLIVALDRPTAAEARALVERIGDEVSFYKIGLELLFGGGISLARDLKSEGKRIFLDMKLLDISNTVERATTGIARLGVDFLTVHGHDRKTL
jgi:orotidine-5'-phosphate decarboxylase